MLTANVNSEATIMAWKDINDIIDDLQEVIHDIEDQHPELNAFKAPIARAIANMRAERKFLETTLPSHFDTESYDNTQYGESTDAALRPLTSTIRSRRVRYGACITNERLIDDIKAIL